MPDQLSLLTDQASLIDRNLLLAELPPPTLDRLRTRLEPVPLPRGASLLHDGERVRYGYFPASGLVSLRGSSADGNAVELVAIGREGLVGFPLVFQGGVSIHSASVQFAGEALRIHTSVLEEQLRTSPPLQHAMLLWSHRVLTDVLETMVCQRFHLVLDRLCCYLLQTAERLDADTLRLTHEALAEVLGVSRKAVNAAALAVHDAGAIRYRHGRIEILDRRRLARSACDCYDTSGARRVDAATGVGGP